VMKCVFSKSYRDDRSSYVYEALRAVRMNSTHGSYGFVFPRPLLHLKPHHTIWQEAWNGVPLSETIVSDSWDDLFPQLARSLAAFHSGTLNGLDLQTGPAPTEVLRNAHDDAADILGFFRDEPAELRNVIERLNSMVDGLAKSATPAVPIHGTFKIAQLLIGNGQIAVVDFDSVAIGDPLYDVAEFLASVLALKERHALPASRVIEGVRLFLTEYSKSVAWDCDRSRIHWFAAAFMLAKIHSSLKTLEIETTDQFERQLDVLCSLLPAAIDG
jgi:aminoglycoside phosphotransferase (APT) family kinase protein